MKRFTGAGMPLMAIICAIIMVFASMYLVAFMHRLLYDREPEIAYSPVEARRLVMECGKLPNMHTVIETEWSAPVGHPRKPVSWRVSCRKQK